MKIGRNRRTLILRAVVPVAAVAVAATVLLRFSPGQYSFYPRCPFYEALHLQCPGCGATRALAALLHGQILEALRLNALTTFMLLPATAYAALCYYRYLGTREFNWPRIPSVGIYAGLAAAMIFTVLRNLPVH